MQFSPDLDPTRLQPLLARHGRLHLPGMLGPQDARAVGLALQDEVPCFQSVKVRGYDLGLDALDTMPAERLGELETAIGAWIRDGR